MSTDAKDMLKEFSPELFFEGLQGMVVSGEYESIEYRIICHRGKCAAENKVEAVATDKQLQQSISLVRDTASNSQNDAITLLRDAHAALYPSVLHKDLWKRIEDYLLSVA